MTDLPLFLPDKYARHMDREATSTGWVVTDIYRPDPPADVPLPASGIFLVAAIAALVCAVRRV